MLFIVLGSNAKRAAIAMQQNAIPVGNMPQAPAASVSPAVAASPATHKVDHRQATNNPAVNNSIGISCRISIGGISGHVSLTENPTLLGRSASLPTELLKALQADNQISRQHCEIWVKQSNNQLYVRTLSVNGLTLEGQSFQQGAKAKVDFNRPISLVLGQTQILITPV